jgi:hypothetical protein
VVGLNPGVPYIIEDSGRQNIWAAVLFVEPKQRGSIAHSHSTAMFIFSIASTVHCFVVMSAIFIVTYCTSTRTPKLAALPILMPSVHASDLSLFFFFFSWMTMVLS